MLKRNDGVDQQFMTVPRRQLQLQITKKRPGMLPIASTGTPGSAPGSPFGCGPASPFGSPRLKRGPVLPGPVLKRKALAYGCGVYSKEFAKKMDGDDKLGEFRERFSYPKMRDLPFTDLSVVNPDDDCIYMCGNSLGLKPKSADEHMRRALEDWGKYAVFSHFVGDLPAASCEEPGRELMARLIGAQRDEVVLMNGLTVNLHLLLLHFYKPTNQRHKILIEAGAFPSDVYAVKSQIRHHGFDPATSLIELEPKQDEDNLRTSDILKCIEKNGDSIAVILFSGVQFYTGQKFDMEMITQTGHRKGCIVGFDLAHAVGNVSLDLHKWEVDFACWCSYKYLNSGAGGLAGIFIHTKNFYRSEAKLQGWWANKRSTRFLMKSDCDALPGPESFQISNPPPWLACLNLASLEIFSEVTIDDLIDKQFLLTGYLELLLRHHFMASTSPLASPSNGFTFFENNHCSTNGTSTNGHSQLRPPVDSSLRRRGSLRTQIEIVTPADPKHRGCQLSLRFSTSVKTIEKRLEKLGVASDIREPDVLRVAPVPLYNSFSDVYRFVQALGTVLNVSIDEDFENGS